MRFLYPFLAALLIAITASSPHSIHPPTAAAGATTLSTAAQVSAQKLPLLWNLTAIGAQKAWAEGATGKGVEVLVIDTGLSAEMVRTTLAGSAAPSLSLPLHETVYDYCDPDISEMECSSHEVTVANPTPYRDDIGHGSFVSCEIVCSGKTDGIWGVAPQARVAMARVVDADGGASSQDIAAAIRWGAIHRIPVMSLSLGSQAPDPVEQHAIQFALHMGSLVVAAAGNGSFYTPGGDTLDYPAAYPGVVAVGATDSKGRLAYFSQYGTGMAQQRLTITAPGVQVKGLTPVAQEDCKGLCAWDGTSMATPEVAGALADLLSLGLTPWQATHALLAGASFYSFYMTPLHYGHGLLNLPNAVHYAREHHWLQ